jgi:hypothetical protein
MHRNAIQTETETETETGETYCVNFHVVGLPSASAMIPAQGYACGRI